jgi:hypothetical protein
VSTGIAFGLERDRYRLCETSLRRKREGRPRRLVSASADSTPETYGGHWKCKHQVGYPPNLASKMGPPGWWSCFLVHLKA